MLIGLGGLYGAAATLGGAANTLASPAELDFTHCKNTKGEEGAPEQCCPPGFGNFIQEEIPVFDLKNYPIPALRVRRPAHVVASDDEYMAKFREAMRRMQALPADDPRSFSSQAQVHCAYCDGSFLQKGHDSKDLRFQVHFSWLFLPFHRAYLYFFERILGNLIDDPTFAIPFWNWDHPDGMWMPSIYSSGGSGNPLYDENRNPLHLSKLLDLSFGGTETNIAKETQIYYNLWHMYIHVARPKDAELFMGGKYTAGAEEDRGKQGMIELLPHNTVHNWCGNRDKGGLDMGNFFSAGRDPIFYAHHANVDRMWSIWKTLPDKYGNRRADYTDRDWLDTYFIFFDENRRPVKIYVRDCLDNQKLGYTYQDVELPWLNPRKPTSSEDHSPSPIPIRPAQEVKLPKALGKGFRTKVSRPKKSRTRMEKKDIEEVLEVKLELGETKEFVKFDVYLNDEHDHSSQGHTKATVSYAGSFTSLPHKGHKHGQKIELKLPITEVIEDIGADHDESVNVVFVSRSGQEAVTITGIKIKYH